MQFELSTFAKIHELSTSLKFYRKIKELKDWNNTMLVKTGKWRVNMVSNLHSITPQTQTTTR